MTTAQTVTLDKQIQDTKRLLWNASQARNSRSVFRLQAELDRLFAEQDRLQGRGR